MSHDEVEVLPPLYAAVLRSGDLLREEYPNGVSTETIGITAWNGLTNFQRSAELPHVLGTYVSRVYDEENSKVMERRAADPAHTYLGDHDTAMLWDSAMDRPNEFHEVPANREALMNVLCELELLQHRLAMHNADGGT